MKFMQYLFLSALLVTFALPSFAEEKEKKTSLENLPAGYQKFLDDTYSIISDFERNAFLQLKTDADRDRFITAFWDSRDPTPGTKQNEFREEHERRVAYAKLHFSKESALPGWKTDRGRIYILMGKPEFVKRYSNEFDFYPMEMWQYVGDRGYGLPTSLVLLFYQRGSSGPYRLYSPIDDGIGKLFIAKREFYSMDEDELWRTMGERLDPEVAAAAVSPIPSEGGLPSDMFASSSAQAVLAKIENARNYQASKRTYVDDILKNKGAIQVYYSIGNEGVTGKVYWFEGPNKQFYVNYAIEYEPNRLDMGQYEDYYTSLSIDGQIANSDKVRVEEIIGTNEIKLTKEQFAQIQKAPFQYQGIRPIVPGKYDLTMVVSNNVSRKSMTFAGNFEIPNMSVSMSPHITPVLLLRTTENVQESGKLRPFQIEDKVLVPNLTGKCQKDQGMKIFHQVIFPDTFLSKDVALHYAIRSKDKVEWEVTEPLQYAGSDLAGNAIDIQRGIPLSTLDFGSKELVVELKSDDRVLAHSDPVSFSVDPEVSPAVWKFSSGIPAYGTSYHTVTIAQQLLRLKKIDQALAVLQEGQTQFPDAVDIKVTTMRVALAGKQYNKVIEVGTPLETKNPRNKELLWLLGWASYGGGKYPDAVRYLERYRMEDATRVEVFNLLGDSYFRLSEPQKSLERLNQSLALNPNQNDIVELKKKVESGQKPN